MCKIAAPYGCSRTACSRLQEFQHRQAVNGKIARRSNVQDLAIGTEVGLVQCRRRGRTVHVASITNPGPSC